MGRNNILPPVKARRSKKITPENFKKIKADLVTMYQVDVAKRYNLSPTTVGKVDRANSYEEYRALVEEVVSNQRLNALRSLEGLDGEPLYWNIKRIAKFVSRTYIAQRTGRTTREIAAMVTSSDYNEFLKTMEHIEGKSDDTTRVRPNRKSVYKEAARRREAKRVIQNKQRMAEKSQETFSIPTPTKAPKTKPVTSKTTATEQNDEAIIKVVFANPMAKAIIISTTIACATVIACTLIWKL